MPFNPGLSDVFSWLAWLTYYWKGYHRVYRSFSVHCIKGPMTLICITHAYVCITNHLAKQVSAKTLFSYGPWSWLPGEKYQQPEICRWYHSNSSKWKGTEKVKEESKMAGLKLNNKKTKIMASSPITSWQIDGETMETVTDFIFLGSKITADGDCSWN